jgi:hypothetical protein
MFQKLKENQKELTYLALGIVLGITGTYLYYK